MESFNIRTFRNKKILLIILIVLTIGIYLSNNKTVNESGTTGLLTQEHHSPPSVVIEQGSGVETASYIIFKDDEGIVYAKNGLTGAIDYSGTNASQIIQASLAGLTSGRSAEEKVVIKGDMTITHTISLPNYLELEIQGKLTFNGSGNMFEGIGTDIGVNRKRYIEIHGGKIVGDYNDANQADLFHFELATDIHIHDIRISGARENGIFFYRVFGLGTGINNAMIDSCTHGAAVKLNRSNDVPIYACDFSSNKYGVYLCNSGFNSIRSTQIENTGIGGDYGDGIYIESGVGTTIENVWMEGYKRYSVYLTDGDTPWGRIMARNTRIINCIFDAYNADPAYDDNLVVDNATNTLIEQCYFQSSPTAIKLNSGADWTTINKNTLDYVNKLVNNSGSNTRYWQNWGWHTLVGNPLNLRTENWGVEASCANETWVAHDLCETPTYVSLTGTTDTTIYLMATNSTHIRIGVGSGTPDVHWYVEYQPQSGTVP